jgi:hypothetical protein
VLIFTCPCQQAPQLLLWEVSVKTRYWWVGLRLPSSVIQEVWGREQAGLRHGLWRHSRSGRETWRTQAGSKPGRMYMGKVTCLIVCSGSWECGLIGTVEWNSWTLTAAEGGDKCGRRVARRKQKRRSRRGMTYRAEVSISNTGNTEFLNVIFLHSLEIWMHGQMSD